MVSGQQTVVLYNPPHNTLFTIYPKEITKMENLLRHLCLPDALENNCNRLIEFEHYLLNRRKQMFNNAPNSLHKFINDFLPPSLHIPSRTSFTHFCTHLTTLEEEGQFSTALKEYLVRRLHYLRSYYNQRLNVATLRRNPNRVESLIDLLFYCDHLMLLFDTPWLLPSEPNYI